MIRGVEIVELRLPVGGAWPELRQRHLVVYLLEDHLERHPDLQLLGADVDDIGHQPRAFLQVDQPDHVRHPLREVRGRRPGGR